MNSPGYFFLPCAAFLDAVRIWAAVLSGHPIVRELERIWGHPDQSTVPFVSGPKSATAKPIRYMNENVKMALP